MHQPFCGSSDVVLLSWVLLRLNAFCAYRLVDFAACWPRRHNCRSAHSWYAANSQLWIFSRRAIPGAAGRSVSSVGGVDPNCFTQLGDGWCSTPATYKRYKLHSCCDSYPLLAHGCPMSFITFPVATTACQVRCGLPYDHEVIADAP